MIPRIHVDTTIQTVGLTASGAVDVPTNSTEVGWFRAGAVPGEVGSAVIDGHLDSKDGSAGVFQNLYELQIGDKIFVQNSSGLLVTFVVWQKKEYDWDAQPSEVFNSTSGIYLNLITCTGVWNFGKQSYGKRLVVFSSIEKSNTN